MRATREKLLGVVRWTGLLGGREALERDVVVVSPHLDDAVFSVGAALSYAARHGARPVVLTVLAGEPGSREPAGDWDRDAGFATAGEAARARRLEDAKACRLVGASPVWLPFGDQQYGRGGTADEIRAAVTAAVGEAHVLLPGFPLLNADHRWLREVLDGAFPPERSALYVEQPYAAEWSGRPGDEAAADRQWTAPPGDWRPLRAGLRDRRRKLAACRAYRSQLPLLGSIVPGILRYELRTGGESATTR